MHFHVSYPLLWLTANLIFALAFSYWLYRANPIKLPKKWMVFGLMFLRFSVLFIIGFLLLDPIVKWVVQTKEKPILVFAIDNSESMVMTQDSTFLKTDFLKQLDQTKQKLQNRFEVVFYGIGAQTEPKNTTDFKAKLSNLSEGIEAIYDNHYNLNLAATILVSDGIYNQGNNPLYALKKGIAPIYTVGTGDTSLHKDALVLRVKHNPTVFVGNDFEILPELKAYACNKQDLKITLLEGNKVLGSQTIQVNGNNFFATPKFTISKATEGIHTYKLAISPLSNEGNYLNNYMEIQVNVVKAKQKVVFLYLCPHPDVSAIIRSIENNPNYELNAYQLADYKDQNISDASMFLLHQIPGSRGEGVRLFKNLTSNQMPLFMILGKQTGLNYLNQISNFTIQGQTQNPNEAQAWINEQFNLFLLDDDLKNTVSKFAPLITPYGNYQIPGDASVLFWQQIGNVKTNAPLLFFTNQNGANRAWLCGEGFWRWRLQDFLLNHNQFQSQALLSKIVQWVSGKNDRSKFRVNPKKKFFDENEPVLFEAELFNDLFEPINQPEITLQVKNTGGKIFRFNFSKEGKSYQLNTGTLPADVYSYEAKVIGNNTYPTKKGAFIVKALQTEALDLKANHTLLKALSNESGGKFYTLQNLNDLLADLEKNESLKTVVFEKDEMKELLNKKWILFLILGLLFLEWFIRKWNGFI